jgi:hypothetical protein
MLEGKSCGDEQLQKLSLFGQVLSYLRNNRYLLGFYSLVDSF